MTSDRNYLLAWEAARIASNLLDVSIAICARDMTWAQAIDAALDPVTDEALSPFPRRLEHVYGRDLALEGVARAISLAATLAQTDDLPPLTCVAEEMIAYRACAGALERWDDDYAPAGWELERLAAAREAITGALDDWFEDHDFRLLENPRLDGFENDPELDARVGLVNLNPRDWLTPFSEGPAWPGRAPE